MPLRLSATSSLSIIVITLASPAAAGPPSFTRLGFLPGSVYSAGYGVSGGGAVVVGVGQIGGDIAFRWTAAGGMVGLGTLPTHNISGAFGVTHDGATVVGGSADGMSPDPLGRTFRWTAAEGLVDLGDLPGGNDFGQAQGVSADGGIIVGMSSSHPGPLELEAFRWSAAAGMVGIGFPPAGVYSDCLGVSADGSVMAGSFADDLFVFQAYRWTTTGEFQPLGFLTGGLESHAAAVSADGTTVVGWNFSFVDPNLVEEAFRWTQATGSMSGLGFLPNGTASHASAVSPDGSFVVGYALDEFGSSVAFIWDEPKGMRNLQNVLSADPVVAAQLAGWMLIEANAVSADGYNIVGTGINPDGYFEAYVAHLASPGGPGDMNCDNAVNPSDVPAFVRGLLDPSDYRIQFPNCNVYNGDVNADGAVDGDDAQGFVGLLIP